LVMETNEKLEDAGEARRGLILRLGSAWEAGDVWTWCWNVLWRMMWRERFGEGTGGTLFLSPGIY